MDVNRCLGTERSFPPKYRTKIGFEKLFLKHKTIRENLITSKSKPGYNICAGLAFEPQHKRTSLP